MHLGSPANIVRPLLFSTKKASCAPFLARKHLLFICLVGRHDVIAISHDGAGGLSGAVPPFWIASEGIEPRLDQSEWETPQHFAPLQGARSALRVGQDSCRSASASTFGHPR